MARELSVTVGIIRRQIDLGFTASPPPMHEWDGTSLRLKNPDGSWGAATNLLGEKGIDGTNGSVITIVNGYWYIDGIDTGILARGTDGTNGIDGKDGATPQIDPVTKHWTINGVDTGILAQGTNGVDGYTPQKGIDYFDGKDGKDGYTPQKNIDYFDGADGANGKDGINGADGTTPHIDSTTKRWFIGEVDTGVSAEGQDGANGVDGQNGITPHIGANLNWWIGETDTGILAQGQNGSDGATGADGVPGTDGQDGAAGADGKSAYQIAVDNGFIGTEAEWLVSLKGADGKDGSGSADGEKDGEIATVYSIDGQDYNITIKYKYSGNTDPATINIGSTPLPIIMLKLYIEDQQSLSTLITSTTELNTIKDNLLIELKAYAIVNEGDMAFSLTVSNIGFIYNNEGGGVWGFDGNVNNLGSTEFIHRLVVFLGGEIIEVMVDENAVERKLDMYVNGGALILYGVNSDGEQTMYGIDDVPTEDSANPIQSGAVFAALGDISTVLDAINGEVM